MAQRLARLAALAPGGALPFLMCVASACGSSEPQTLLRVCSDLDPGDIQTVQVVVTDTRGGEQLSALVASRTLGEVTFPLTTEIPRLEGPGFIRAEARSGGLLLGRFSYRIPNLAELDALQLPLMAACERFSCDQGDTCIEGECEQAPLPGEGPRCP